MHNTNNYKFSTLIAGEEQKIEQNARKLMANGLSSELLKLVKGLTLKSPSLLNKVGGLKSVINVIKHKVDDEHSKIIKELIIKSIAHYSADRAIRAALKTCIDRQYSEYHGWHPGPIRFYVPNRDNTPYINNQGILSTGASETRTSWNQMDASWLWNDHCVYLWHRWVNNPSHKLVVKSELKCLSEAIVTDSSLYGDYPSTILCLIHGYDVPHIKMSNGIHLLNDPWTLNETLLKATS